MKKYTYTIKLGLIIAILVNSYVAAAAVRPSQVAAKPPVVVTPPRPAAHVPPPRGPAAYVAPPVKEEEEVVVPPVKEEVVAPVTSPSNPDQLTADESAAAVLAAGLYSTAGNAINNGENATEGRSVKAAEDKLKSTIAGALAQRASNDPAKAKAAEALIKAIIQGIQSKEISAADKTKAIELLVGQAAAAAPQYALNITTAALSVSPENAAAISSAVLAADKNISSKDTSAIIAAAVTANKDQVNQITKGAIAAQPTLIDVIVKSATDTRDAQIVAFIQSTVVDSTTQQQETLVSQSKQTAAIIVEAATTKANSECGNDQKCFTKIFNETTTDLSSKTKTPPEDVIADIKTLIKDNPSVSSH